MENQVNIFIEEKVLFSLFSCSDPYVKVWLMFGEKRVEKKKTPVYKCNLNPTFNQVRQSKQGGILILYFLFFRLLSLMYHGSRSETVLWTLLSWILIPLGVMR